MRLSAVRLCVLTLTLMIWAVGVPGVHSNPVASLNAAAGSARIQSGIGENAFQPGAEEHPGERATEEHGENDGGGLLPVIAKAVNAAILVATLIYFLRAPLASYLASRSAQVRQELVTAAEMRETAKRQIEEVDRRLAALPGEIEALKSRGADEIAAEGARIQQLANTERERLIEQTKREIDLQLRVAQRELIAHASELAVGLAGQRIKRNITDEDQRRLIDRYVEQIGADTRVPRR